jgi:hypothetical protein
MDLSKRGEVSIITFQIPGDNRYSTEVMPHLWNT